MRDRHHRAAILAAFTMLVPLGCSNPRQQPVEGQGPAPEGAVSIYVVNYPLKYFAERIGG